MPQAAEAVLRALSPLGLRASVDAAVELGRGDDEKEKALGRQVEQLDYEAKRAFEQYNEVDPRNRLVATELERRWNEKLRELESARGELTTLVSSRPVVTEEQREELLTLGERFDAVCHRASLQSLRHSQPLRRGALPPPHRAHQRSLHQLPVDLHRHPAARMTISTSGDVY